MKKRYIFKIYSPDDTFLKVWTSAKLQRFVKEINGGLGECVIELGEKFDYDGPELALGNFVEIFVNDTEEQMTERLIYRGYISRFNPFVVQKKEKIEVTLLGYQTFLSLDYLKNGTTTTLYSNTGAGLSTSGPATASDIGLMMRTLIDRYRAETANPKINYTNTSIPLTPADTATFLFEQKFYREAMDDILKLAPANYYYFVDENGTVFFREIPSTPTWRFTFSRNISMINVGRNIERLRNFVLVWDGQAAGVYNHYEDAASILKYGRRAARIIDYGIEDSAGADSIGEKFIAEMKDPEARVIVEIIDDESSDNGLNIEMIKPGDTILFLNYDDIFTDIFKYNLLITEVVYFPGTPHRLRTICEIIKSNLFELQKRTDRKVNDVAVAGGIPATYT